MLQKLDILRQVLGFLMSDPDIRSQKTVSRSMRTATTCESLEEEWNQAFCDKYLRTIWFKVIMGKRVRDALPHQVSVLA